MKNNKNCFFLFCLLLLFSLQFFPTYLLLNFQEDWLERMENGSPVNAECQPYITEVFSKTEEYFNKPDQNKTPCNFENNEIEVQSQSISGKLL